MHGRYAAAFLFCAVLCAQSQTNQPRFALEIPGPEGYPPRYVNVQDHAVHSLLSYGQSLRRLSGAASSGATDPTALRISYPADGDNVVMTVTLYFGAFDKNTTPQSLEGVPQKQAGTYRARLNESVTFREMDRFGLQPWTVNVVTPEPPVPTHPATISRVPSLQIEVAGEDRMGVKLSVRNLSSRGVTAFLVERPTQGGSSGLQQGDGSGPVLIVPGATRELPPFGGGGGRMTPNGFVPDRTPPVFIVRAALFEDGTSEGEPDAVARMEAGRLARMAQKKRLRELVDAIVADPASNDDAKIARIREEVPKVAAEPDESMLAEIRSRFPNLPPDAWTAVMGSVRARLANEKERLLFNLDGRFGRISLADWWKVAKER